MSKLVRLKPYNPRKGFVLRRYMLSGLGLRFDAGAGWYRVSDQVATYLENVRETAEDSISPCAFDVCTEEEAQAIEKEEARRAAAEVAKAEAPRIFPASDGITPVALTTADLPKPFVPSSDGEAPPSPPLGPPPEVPRRVGRVRKEVGS